MAKKRKLSKLQEIELGILHEVDSLCGENDITYFLIGGSMLGAIRHRGFVPWDDDIDIALVREDYDRFLEIAEKDLEEPFELHTYKNNPSHHYYFAHVVDNRYQIRRVGSQDKRVEDVWVDVYPIDGLPDNPIVLGVHSCKCLFYRFMYHLAYFEKISISREDRPLSQRIILNVIKPFHGLLRPDKNKWRDRMDKCLRKYKVKDSKRSINFISVYLMRELFPSSIFTDLDYYTFEDMQVRGPKDYDQYLSHMYGDYMTPISADKVHPVEVLFDE